MPLPPVESVEVVIKTPESDKGRDRVRRPGDRQRAPDQRRRRPTRRGSSKQPEEEADTSMPQGGQPTEGGDDAENATAHPPRAYGPDADLHEDQQEHHIDYRA